MELLSNPIIWISAASAAILIMAFAPELVRKLPIFGGASGVKRTHDHRNASILHPTLGPARILKTLDTRHLGINTPALIQTLRDAGYAEGEIDNLKRVLSVPVKEFYMLTDRGMAQILNTNCIPTDPAQFDNGCMIYDTSASADILSLTNKLSTLSLVITAKEQEKQMLIAPHYSFMAEFGEKSSKLRKQLGGAIVMAPTPKVPGQYSGQMPMGGETE